MHAGLWDCVDKHCYLLCVIGFMIVIVDAADEDSTSQDEVALNVTRRCRNVVVMQLLCHTWCTWACVESVFNLWMKKINTWISSGCVRFMEDTSLEVFWSQAWHYVSKSHDILSDFLWNFRCDHVVLHVVRWRVFDWFLTENQTKSYLVPSNTWTCRSKNVWVLMPALTV